MAVTTVTTSPGTSHSGINTSRCAFRHAPKMFVLWRCVDTQLLWTGLATLRHFVYMCWGAVRRSAVGTILHTVSAIHVPMSTLILSFCTSISVVKANVSNVQWVPYDHRTVRLFHRSSKVIVGSNPMNSGHASKPNFFKFPPLKTCGLWSYWWSDFPVVVGAAAAVLQYQHYNV